MANRRKIRQQTKAMSLDAPAVWPENGLCPLCGRQMIKGPTVNEHHLVPRTYGGTDKRALHRVCHSKIHSVFREAELKKFYHTFERLKSHPEITKFIEWLSNKDPEFMTKHRS